MGDIKMVVRYCAVENVPYEQSEFFRICAALHGEETALKLTYEVEVPCSTTSLLKSDTQSQETA